VAPGRPTSRRQAHGAREGGAASRLVSRDAGCRWGRPSAFFSSSECSRGPSRACPMPLEENRRHRCRLGSPLRRRSPRPSQRRRNGLNRRPHVLNHRPPGPNQCPHEWIRCRHTPNRSIDAGDDGSPWGNDVPAPGTSSASVLPLKLLFVPAKGCQNTGPALAGRTRCPRICNTLGRAKRVRASTVGWVEERNPACDAASAWLVPKLRLGNPVGKLQLPASLVKRESGASRRGFSSRSLGTSRA
jgi:hypothetical protein